MNGAGGMRSLDWILGLRRGTGHTVAAARGARPSGVVITINEREASRVRQLYDVEAHGLDVGDREMRGREVAVVFDTAAVQRIVEHYEKRIAELNSNMQDDLAHLLSAAGLGVHARSESPRRVMLDELLPRIREMSDAITWTPS